MSSGPSAINTTCGTSGSTLPGVGSNGTTIRVLPRRSAVRWLIGRRRGNLARGQQRDAAGVEADLDGLDAIELADLLSTTDFTQWSHVIPVTVTWIRKCESMDT
ncbi:hypothetical protein GCM10009608_35740 [Pseudonocardia alaniniphila]